MVGGRPLVSIGMPVQNSSRTIGVAIRSLLAQTFGDWELLVIDDGSTDNTPKIVSQHEDKRIRLQVDGFRLGLAVRLNQAIELSRGKYFARMDSDDVAYPLRLERQVSYLQANPEVDLVGAWTLVFGRHGAAIGKRIAPQTHEAICARPMAGFPVAHPTYLGRLEWFRCYRYHESRLRCEDQDLLLRSYRYSRFANLPEILLGYREERIDLRKILTGRYHFLHSVVRDCFRQRRFDLLVRAMLEQGLKSSLDCIAVGTGLNYRLLRHRAAPVTPSERQAWEHVWQSVSHSRFTQLPT